MNQQPTDITTELRKELLKEKRASRKQGVFFKSLAVIYVGFITLAFLASFLGGSMGSDEPHVAIIPITGIIKEGAEASANNLVEPIRDAFEEDNAVAIVLAINSPGGSPVQSGYIYDEIIRLKLLHPEKKVYSVISDLGASGGYYIAAAADEIYANRASLVGSIVVTASGFGFVNLIDKVGVERRTYTSGSNKNFLDPFLASNSDQGVFWSSVLGGVHEQFKDVVIQSRKGKIDIANKELFSGLIWNGEQALKLGLIDGLESAGSLSRDVIGEEEIRIYERKKTAVEQLLSPLKTEFKSTIDTLSTTGNYSLY